MARYIDADKARMAIAECFLDMNDSFVESATECNAMIDLAIDKIKELPTADVVEVVRCKDCQHYWDGRTQCDVHDGVNYNPDDYCSYAERKTK